MLMCKPQNMMEMFEEQVLNEGAGGDQHASHMNQQIKSKQKQEQIKRSIEIMKKKFEAKSNLDILRYFDRLGIDLITNNQTLYD